MAPPMYLCARTLFLLFCLISLLFVSGCFSETQSQSKELESSSQNEQEPSLKKTKPIKPNNLSPKNQTKPIKTTNLSSKNQTKLIKSTNESSKNQTKPIKVTSFSSNSTTKIKKLNSTSKISTKTQKPIKEIKNTDKKSDNNIMDDDDFVSELKDLPMRFQQTIIPDLTRISSTSRSYINKANKEITRNFKPYVGNKYASTITTVLSFVVILIPLALISLIFNRVKAYFSLQRLLIFIQIYLSIYFFTLCFVSVITSLEPLRFLYATSQSTYVCLQVIQTVGYVLYLLLLAMYLVLVFSTDCGPGSRFVGLAQTFVGFSVGLHYYVTVFHRVVLRQAPRTNWKVHGVYATCFLLSCLIAKADRRKKAYMEDGGEEGKKN